MRAIIIEREPDDILLLVSRFGSGAYSAKLFAGTRQRFSGFSHPRQCGEEVLRIFVTGGPPVCGGGGIPQRINYLALAVWRRAVWSKGDGHRDSPDRN
jgi:hypothetical protein